MTTLQHPHRTHEASFSIPSILAIVAAIGSFAVTPGYALLLCIVAALLGTFGIVLALMPGIRGGFISMLSLLMGAAGGLVALVRLIASL